MEYTGNRLHPTQKPLCILTPLIQSFSRAGNVVLNPFYDSTLARSEASRPSVQTI